MMHIKRKDKLKILEYKFVYEENIHVLKEFEAGSADLNYRLSFFREKIANQNTEQKQRYDEIFYSQNNSKEGLVNIDTEKELITSNSAKKPGSSIKPWAKSVYKKIILATHPDKTKGLPSKNLIDQLTEKYLITQNAYQNKIYSDLIMVAYDLNIEVPENIIIEEIQPSIDLKLKENKEKRKTLGWQWFHVPDQQKDAELKKILVILGFKFTENKINEVIKRKYIKRKVGTRPEKINVKKRKLK